MAQHFLTLQAQPLAAAPTAASDRCKTPVSDDISDASTDSRTVEDVDAHFAEVLVEEPARKKRRRGSKPAADPPLERQFATEHTLLESVVQSLWKTDEAVCVARVRARRPATDDLAALFFGAPSVYKNVVLMAVQIKKTQGDKLMEGNEVRHSLLCASIRLLRWYEKRDAKGVKTGC